MAKFTKENQPEGRGRPAGSPNKQKALFRAQGKQLLHDLMTRALAGCDESAKLVLPFLSKPKNYTEQDTLDGQLLEAKIKEITELEKRLEALEQATEK